MRNTTYSTKAQGYQIRNDGIYFITMTVIDWVDVFTRPVYKDIIINSLKYCCQHKGLDLYAYVIMSNHVHLIASTPKLHLGQIIGDMKKFTCKRIIEAIQEENESRQKWMLWHFRQQGKRNSNNWIYQFWIQNNHPVLLDNIEKQHQRLDYLHQNPVRAGIVYRPEDYVYSSASNYAGLDSLIEVKFLGSAVR
jgi:putative transposase